MKPFYFGIILCQAFLLVASLPSWTWRSDKNEERSQIQAEPLYYGWFFNDSVALDLDDITKTYMSAVYGAVPDFARFIDDNALANNVTSPLKYYTKPLDPNTGNFDPLYHITAKYCGLSDCSSYTNRVENLLGKYFLTNMIGLVFTNRTYGIRIKLSEDQQQIFDEENTYKNENYYSYDSSNSRLRHTSNPHTNFIPIAGMNLKPQNKKKTERVTKITNDLKSPLNISDYINFIPQEENYHPVESRAHVTIGVAPNVSAVVTGLDLLQVVELERNQSLVCNIYRLGFANLTQIGPDCDIFVLYLHYRMETYTTFQVYNQPSSASYLTTTYNMFSKYLSLISVVPLMNSAIEWFNSK